MNEALIHRRQNKTKVIGIALICLNFTYNPVCQEHQFEHKHLSIFDKEIMFLHAKY